MSESQRVFTQPLASSLAQLKSAVEWKCKSAGISSGSFYCLTQWLRGHEQAVAEIIVFPVYTGDLAALDTMEATLIALPGVYRVARIMSGKFGRHRGDLRRQVRALMAMHSIAFERQPLGRGGWAMHDDGVEFQGGSSARSPKP
jgi:hypothetical protein